MLKRIIFIISLLIVLPIAALCQNSLDLYRVPTYSPAPDYDVLISKWGSEVVVKVVTTDSARSIRLSLHRRSGRIVYETDINMLDHHIHYIRFKALHNQRYAVIARSGDMVLVKHFSRWNYRND